MTQRSRNSQMDRGTPARAESEQTILAVEPSKLLGKVLADVCKNRGVAVRFCEEVGAALSMVAGRKPAAVLSSFELPGLSGASLIAALKACPRHRGIPIGLMTAEDSLDQFLSVYKPDVLIQKKSDFKNKLEEFLEKYGIGGKGQTDDTSASRRRSGKILLAEDTQMIQKLIGTFLHVAGAEVVIVENGAEAVFAASEEPFDLILMDIEMPKMDGREAAGKIRANGITVPMIASTAHDRDSFLNEALKLGFDDVLAKPAKRQVLIDTCAKHMARGTA